MKTRYFINLCFKGTRYHGWQSQPNALSVQQVVNNALSTVIRDEISTAGAGRTDTGVHARFFTAHFDSHFDDLAIRKTGIIRQLNGFLPADIAISDLYKVSPDAHARFSAISRTYEYTILRCKNPFLDEFAWLYTANLNVNKMNEAAKILMDNDNFTSFAKLHSNNKTPICKVEYAIWKETEGKYTFAIKADRFLRNMVRAIVGTLIEAGKGKINKNDFLNIINLRNRSFAGVSVPACGLALTDIEYPKSIFEEC